MNSHHGDDKAMLGRTGAERGLGSSGINPRISKDLEGGIKPSPSGTFTMASN